MQNKKQRYTYTWKWDYVALLHNFGIIWSEKNVAMVKQQNESKTNPQIPFPVKWGKCSGALVLPSWSRNNC